MSLKQLAEAQGWVLLPDQDQYTNRIEFAGSSGQKYMISFDSTLKEWRCNDTGWRRKHPCKHLQKMIPLIEQAVGKG